MPAVQGRLGHTNDSIWTGWTLTDDQNTVYRLVGAQDTLNVLREGKWATIEEAEFFNDLVVVPSAAHVRILYDSNENDRHTDTVYTLTEWARQEALEEHLPLPKAPVSIQAKVARASPLLPNASIHLIELQEKDLRSLVLAPAPLTPGDAVVWHGLQRKRRKAAGRIWMASKAAQILDSSDWVPDMQGTIQAVHWYKQRIQRIQIQPADGTACCLWLSVYPVSHTLQLTLTVGAVIRAYHVHWVVLEQHAVACIQTALQVVELSSALSTSPLYVPVIYTTNVAELIIRHQLQSYPPRVVEEYLQHWNTAPAAATVDAYEQFFDHDSACSHDIILPRVVSLSKISNLVLREAQQRLFRVPKGWIGSFTIPQDHDCYTGGICWKGKSNYISLLEEGLSVPVILASEHALVEIESVVGRVTAITVSCLCIQSETNRNESANLGCHCHDNQTPPQGCCTVMSKGSQLFLVSFHLRMDSLLPRTEPVQPCRESSHSLLDCLACRNPSTLHKKTVQVLYVRKQLNFFKARHGNFQGLSLTVSHVPAGSVMDTIQSTDFKVSIPVESQSFKRLSRLLYGLDPESVAASYAWWSLSCNESKCLLVTGGWDEVVGGNQIEGMVIRMPTSVFQKEKRGYLRLRCNVEDLTITERTLSTEQAADQDTNKWDTLSGSRHLPGTLNRRQMSTESQRSVSGRSQDIGVTTETLSSFMRRLCNDLSTSSQRSEMSPSQVFKIKDVYLCSISYCKVWAECTMCFSALEESTEKSLLNREKTQDMRHLKCPNGCNTALFGGIKWECSCMIDDGFAQAKLYSERDCAIKLLQVPNEHVAYIEKGACCEPLVYAKGAPPSLILQSAVLSARNGAAYAKSKLNDTTALTEADVLAKMDDVPRANYLVQRYSRNGQQRRRDYHIRCKPLSDSVEYVNHADIDLLGSETATSYTLPPLKLDLVDIRSAFA